VLSSGWVEAQRSALTPTRVGRWHIRAPWHDEPADVDLAYQLIIEPGVADIGTGTGVAAIVAARHGASVRAIESDEDAINVAWGNIERNSMYPFDSTGDRIELLFGDGAELTVDADELVVANVTLDIHRKIARIASTARRLIVSGILCNQVREAQHLYAGHLASSIRTSGEWAAIELVSIESMGRKN